MSDMNCPSCGRASETMAGICAACCEGDKYTRAITRDTARYGITVEQWWRIFNGIDDALEGVCLSLMTHGASVYWAARNIGAPIPSGYNLGE